MLGWGQPEIGHQLARIVQPVKIPDFGQHNIGDDESDPTQGLDRFNHRRQ